MLARCDVQCVLLPLVSGPHRNVILLPLFLSPWRKSSCPQQSLLENEMWPPQSVTRQFSP